MKVKSLYILAECDPIDHVEIKPSHENKQLWDTDNEFQQIHQGLCPAEHRYLTGLFLIHRIVPYGSNTHAEFQCALRLWT